MSKYMQVTVTLFSDLDDESLLYIHQKLEELLIINILKSSNKLELEFIGQKSFDVISVGSK